MREIKFSEALGEATLAAMKENPKVFILGEGVDDPKGIFGTTSVALEAFGADRVMDMPLSECAMTGVGIGAALQGSPCIMVHQRNEFLLLAMDQVINHAAKWRYMFGGTMSIPIVIRVLIGRGWGQAAQHSQSFHAMFAHVPGLKVILPSTPYEAKGLMYAAIKDPNPVISVEHRWLYNKVGEVPEEAYEIPIGKANLLNEGSDVTCVATSFQVYEAMEARTQLLKEGIDMEIIDLRSARPLDKETILASVRKTGRLIVTDIAHTTGGITGEIAAVVCEEAFSSLKAPIVRIALPDCPTPCSYALESVFYPKVSDIVDAARKLVRGPRMTAPRSSNQGAETDVNFTGPF